jgi:uncharacterized damage-inducible protein DinB
VLDRSAVAELFRQIIEGDDIPTPSAVLKIKAADAVRELESLPYSLATNLAHAVLWQRLWLNALRGGKAKSGMAEWKDNFRVPEPSEWDGLRKEFLEGLGEADRIAKSEPFDHQLATDELAVEYLLKIAIHASYHLGQMNLIKRSVRKSSLTGNLDASLGDSS